MVASPNALMGATFGPSTSSTGTSTEYALTINPLTRRIVDGQAIAFRAHVANTGAATLTVQTSFGPTTAPLRKPGKVGLRAVRAGEIAAGQQILVTYDSALNVWQLLSQSERDAISVMDFGAVGNGTTDDTAAVTAAINAVQALPNVGRLYFPPGLYKITAPLPPLRGRITFEGDNPLASKLVCSGNHTVLTVAGSGTRAAWVMFKDITVDCTGMTSATAVALDWAQYVIFDRFYLSGAWNGISIRQTSSVIFNDCLIDNLKGVRGVYAYGDNTARNGQVDRIDVVVFRNTIVQSDHVNGGVTNTVECVVLDGYVHTVQMDGLRCLSAARGLVTLNTPGLASNLVPRFLFGDSLEVEGMRFGGVKLTAATDVNLDYIFVATTGGDGVELNAGVGTFAVKSGTITSSLYHGINTTGAAVVELGQVLIYNNSQVGVGLKSGVYATGATKISGYGGSWGKATWMPAYTEPQAYGIQLEAAYSGVVTLNGVDLRLNATASLFDGGSSSVGSYVTGCPGYNPGSTALVTVGASPWSYTAGLTPESVMLYDGAGVVASIDGVVVTKFTTVTIPLAPRKTVSISYSTVPTMAVVKQ